MDPSWVNVKLEIIFRRNLQVLHIADEVINEILLTWKDGFSGMVPKKNQGMCNGHKGIDVHKYEDMRFSLLGVHDMVCTPTKFKLQRHK